ncbi:MAG: hypothetical protein J7M25_14955 [Deltaproteobacteria bacterium]|nr:hypothetical protein [Deltaproteobacteria bacterium]
MTGRIHSPSGIQKLEAILHQKLGHQDSHRAQAAWLAIAFLLPVLGSCHPPPVNLCPVVHNYRASSYKKVLHRWTRSGMVIRELDTTIRASATYFSWDFCQAYAAKWATMFGLSATEAAAFRKKLLADKSAHIDFYVAVATSNPNLNELHDPDSIWKMTLIGANGLRAHPEHVEHVDPLTDTQKNLFPYTGLFYEAYLVRFPKTVAGRPELPADDTKKFTLQFAGPKGKLLLTWKVRHRGPCR